MQSADLQACLGFLQAIHYSAKVAKVNKEVCQSLSRVIGRIRPCLEEVDMAEPDKTEKHTSSLRMIETSLENIHVAIGRFSTMGYFQSVLEAQAMCENFSRSRDTMITALEDLEKSRDTCSTVDWKQDIRRIRELLSGLRFEDCGHLRVAKSVHKTSREIIEGKISLKDGQAIIRNQFLSNRSISPKDMQQEIDGLERELSRARVEKQQHEVEELHTIIRALKQSSSESEQDSRPQPPVEYLCPISRRIMKDPVVLVETGQTYDRKYIEEWFGRGNRTCPATKQSVTGLNLTPNYALKSLASSWLDVNSGGDDGEDDDSIVFHRGATETPDLKKALISEDLKKDVVPLGACETKIMVAHSTMATPGLSQALGTSTSVNRKSLIRKEGIEVGGASRESYGGKSQLVFPQVEDPTAKPAEVIHAKKQDKQMQTANAINPVASTVAANTSMNHGALRAEGARHGVAAFGIPSLHSRLAQVVRGQARYAEFAETRSTEQYDASTPRSGISERTKRMGSTDSVGLHSAMQALTRARQLLQLEYDAEESTPRSTRSTGRVLFRADGRNAQYRRYNSARRMPNYGTPSVCSGTSRNSGGCEKDVDPKYYDELEKFENDSDTATEQQATDEAEEDSNGSPEFDTASLTTIGSYAPHYAASVASMRPASLAGFKISSGMMQGATNVLFGDGDDDDDGSLSGNEGEDTDEVALPVMVNLLKTSEPVLAASVANDLAIQAQTNPAVLQDIPRLDVIPSLVKVLSLPSDAARSAAARALGVIGERCHEARLQILDAGAITILSRLNKQAEESQKSVPDECSMEDLVLATRFALGALSGHAKNAPSVDVAPQMLIELLNSSEEDMQASAVLELLEKLNSVYGEMVLKELTSHDVVMSLVDMLENGESDVQLAAAEILSRMIFHDQKTQKELSESIGIVSKLLRLVKQGGAESLSCKAAAAQVVRGLAHNSSKIREDVLKRGVIPEFASLLCCNDPQIRETAAWMLGSLASHSQKGQVEVASCDQAMFMLDHIAEKGMAQEKVAARFALRAVNVSDASYEEDDELSSPIVIHSLEHGTKEVKIAAAWELCRMASGNQWSQKEIYECGGVTSLLKYLKARPGPDGVQAGLATLVKLAGNDARISSEISQEGGMFVAVRLLKSPATPDKKLVIQLLTLLASKCPLHQKEVVQNGAVPVLVDLLFSEKNICAAAYEALCCLVDNEMTQISTSVAEIATPTLLEIIANSESPSFSKKTAIQLLGKMGRASYESQQIILEQQGVDILMEAMQERNEPEVLSAIAQSMNALNSRVFKEQGAGTVSKLARELQTSMANRKPKTPGIVQMSDYNPTPTLMSYGSFGSSKGTHSLPEQRSFSRAHSRKPSFAPTLCLPAVPESVREESEVDEIQDTESATIQEAPESPLSRTTYEPTPKRAPFDQHSCHDTYSDCIEPILEDPAERKSRPAPSVASTTRRTVSSRGSEKETEIKKPVRELSQQEMVPLHTIKQDLQRNLGRAPQSSQTTVAQIRRITTANPRMCSEIIRNGTVGLLLERLKPHASR